MCEDLFMTHYQSINSSEDEYFSNEAFKKINGLNILRKCKYNRVMSEEEKRVISYEAFNLLLFWVQCDVLVIEQFEIFMSILITFSERIISPIDIEITAAMIEVMKLIDFKKHVIQTTVELYIESPDLLRYSFKAVH
jgi:hypothetical protein